MSANLLEQIFTKIQISIVNFFSSSVRIENSFGSPKVVEGVFFVCFCFKNQKYHQRQNFLPSKFHFEFVPFFLYFSYPDVQQIVEQGREGIKISVLELTVI